MKPACITLVIILMAPTLFAAEPGAVPEKQAAVKDDPKLPMVLIIGDSISMGYTPEVVPLMAGKANIHHNAGNGGPTSRGIENIDKWLGDTKWAVIHFNFGLHDLRTSTGGKTDKPEPTGHQVTPEQYEKNLREVVAKMKKTGAKVIWANTTPVPEGKLNPARSNADVIAYNAIAAKVMQDNGIPTDDLYNLVLPQEADVQLKQNVHFTKDGYKVLAKQVADQIEKALAR